MWLHGVGERNDRGNLLLHLILYHRLCAMTTFFTKAEHRKWTSTNLKGTIKKDIDFIITNKKGIVNDVTVLNKISIGSTQRKLGRKYQ